MSRPDRRSPRAGGANIGRQRRSIGLRPSGGAATGAKIVQRLLLNVGEDVEEPATRLTLVEAAVGVAAPLPAPASRGKDFPRILVIQASQADLLEII